MGLYDELTVELPLPDGLDPAGLVFQTKDTAAQYLDRYVLRADGTLWNQSRGEAEEYHGALAFYTGNWAGLCGNLYMTADDAPPWTAEYEALFDRGRLVRIDGPGRRPVEGVEHVLRADFERRCAERRAALARPGDDLQGEWIDFMTFSLGDPFEAVKLPALALRLSHLRGQMAWGGGPLPDAPTELRRLHDWTAAQPDLPPELADLVARTRRFLDGLEAAAATAVGEQVDGSGVDWSTCQETYGMVGEEYVRCGAPATMLVKPRGRLEGPYQMCSSCGTHNVRNRGCDLLARRPDSGPGGAEP